MRPCDRIRVRESCLAASSGKPWTQVDDSTNLKEGLVALRIDGDAKATRAPEESGLTSLGMDTAQPGARANEGEAAGTRGGQVIGAWS